MQGRSGVGALCPGASAGRCTSAYERPSSHSPQGRGVGAAWRSLRPGAGRTGAKRLSRARGRWGDRDVPQRILSAATLRPFNRPVGPCCHVPPLFLPDNIQPVVKPVAASLSIGSDLVSTRLGGSLLVSKTRVYSLERQSQADDSIEKVIQVLRAA